MIWMKCISVRFEGKQNALDANDKEYKKGREDRAIFKSRHEGSVMKIPKTLICMCAHFLSK